MRISILLLLTACSADNPVAKPNLVGKNGGVVSASDGTAVTIGPLALVADTNVTIVPTPDATPPVTTTPVGTPYTFGPEGTQFAQPVTVTLAVDPRKLPFNKSASDIVIYTAPAGSTAYVRLTTSPVDATHVVAQVSHFSVFVPVVPEDDTPVNFADMVLLPIDLALAPQDMSTADCLVSCKTTSITCGCSTTCGGVVYSLSCEMGSGMLYCNCLGGGVSKVVTGSGDCSTTTPLPALFDQCGFPVPR